jgi:hypothetical protein
MTKPAIKLMPDYQCWPLWHHGGSRVGNIDPRELGLSDALVGALEHWKEVYDSHLDLADPASTRWTKEEEAEFERLGRMLCRDLAREIGDRFSVVYSSRCIPVDAL